MYTYQDFEQDLSRGTVIEAVKNVIARYKETEMYKVAKDAAEYAKSKNVTIMEYQKFLYTEIGERIPDEYSACYKIPSRFFDIFITQEVQYLLGNGITWDNPKAVKKKFGKKFYKMVKKAARQALIGAVSYSFYNMDHIDVFGADEFAPAWDEYNGSLRVGVRFWQIDKYKPIEVVLFEEDGYTLIELNNGRDETPDRIVQEKRPYKVTISRSQAEGEWISGTSNYSALPVVPLWANENKQSEIVGIREGIDCYDLIKSGFASDVDEASLIYWIIQNAGGMSDMDIKKFMSKLKTLHAAAVQDESHAESHTVDVPYQSRESILERVKRDLYRDAMALDVENIAGGAITATQIKAAYEALNEKTDGFETNVTDYLEQLCELAGIEENPTYTRSIIVNKTEDAQLVLQAAQFLPAEYIIEKLLTILGDADKVEDILKQLEEQKMQQMYEQEAMMQEEMPEEEEEEAGEEEADDKESSALEDYSADIIKMLEKLLKETEG